MASPATALIASFLVDPTTPGTGTIPVTDIDDARGGPKLKAVQIVSIPEQAAFSIGPASKYLGVCPNTLRTKADLGLIPCRQDENGKRVFLLKDLDNYLKSLPSYQHNGNPFSNRPVKTGREKGGTT